MMRLRRLTRFSGKAEGRWRSCGWQNQHARVWVQRQDRQCAIWRTKNP